MDTITSKRDTSILIKLTPQEKEHITQNARAYGATVSEFARSQLLHPAGSALSGAPMQTVVCELCRLLEGIKEVNDTELRHNLEERVENIWHSIK